MKPHKIYSDNIEGKALAQFYDAMKQDFVIQGALMPDAHAGYSLPIGAVVLTKDMIVPAWVGYDVGCTDKDTEFLTSRGWIPISQYNNEDIMLYDLKTDRAFLDKPKAYIVNDCEEFYLLDNKVVNQALTLDHKLLIFGAKSNSPSDILLEDALIKNNTLSKGMTSRFRSDIPVDSTKDLDFTDSEIRLILAIQADGCIRSSGRVEFHIKKQRKIDRLLELLEILDIEPNLYDMKDGTFGCSLLFNKATKDLSIFWGASARQLKVITEEVQHWDGHKTVEGKVTYSSTNKANIDLIQYAFASIGIRSNFTATVHETWNTLYQLYTTKNNYIGFPKPKYITIIPSEDGKSYCFNTSTGYWIMRRNGKITITGNCGMCAVKTTFKKSEVVENAKSIVEGISARVPVGFNHNKMAKIMPSSLADLPCSPMVKSIMETNGLNQLGSLGGGNHFIEIGFDEEDAIWVVIHSGSRNLGHKVATHYMKVASNSEKAKEGHYALDAALAEGFAYRKDQEYCLQFALASRLEMLDQIEAALISATGSKRDYFHWDTLVNRTHNHVEYNKELKGYIHRKGATHAEEGMTGVIPGNMRDGSFIVRGKGCPDSLNSSSHGAGRVLGRRAAKECLDIEDFEEAMVGITANVSRGTLDESPMAYKDIYQVMADQSDLVDIMHCVRPLINVKG